MICQSWSIGSSIIMIDDHNHWFWLIGSSIILIGLMIYHIIAVPYNPLPPTLVHSWLKLAKPPWCLASYFISQMFYWLSSVGREIVRTWWPLLSPCDQIHIPTVVRVSIHVRDRGGEEKEGLEEKNVLLDKWGQYEIFKLLILLVYVLTKLDLRPNMCNILLQVNEWILSNPKLEVNH